jgi:hypothetical protein
MAVASESHFNEPIRLFLLFMLPQCSGNQWLQLSEGHFNEQVLPLLLTAAPHARTDTATLNAAMDIVARDKNAALAALAKVVGECVLRACEKLYGLCTTSRCSLWMFAYSRYAFSALVLREVVGLPVASSTPYKAAQN